MSEDYREHTTVYRSIMFHINLGSFGDAFLETPKRHVARFKTEIRLESQPVVLSVIRI